MYPPLGEDPAYPPPYSSGGGGSSRDVSALFAADGDVRGRHSPREVSGLFAPAENDGVCKRQHFL